MAYFKSTRIALLAAVVFVSCAIAAAGRANAATDLCAANLTDIRAVAPSDAGATSYTYRLVAFHAGTVDATILADTDHGWKTWTVRGVVLSKARRAYTVPAGPSVPFDVAQSPILGVSMSPAVRIAHVWVAAANGNACEPPSLGNGELVDFQLGRSVEDPGDVASSSESSDSTAPFDATCATPFVGVTALKAIAPNLTELAKRTIDESGGESISFAVEVDASGKALDAWLLGAVGNVADFERTTYAAARSTTYRNAISYCRAVPAIYIFAATANPD